MGRRAASVLLILVGSAALGACVDEDVVFEDRPIYQRVAAIAGGFVGYADPSSDDKLTVCGQCHGDLQAQWQTTAHADAWDGLQSSDHAQEFCEACHTVNSYGNIAAETTEGGATGGHAAIETEDGRYLDVQCESCHGPGLDHVLDPGVINVPLAPIQTGADLSFGCGECHSGTHHPFVEEWEQSPHANVSTIAATNMEDGCYTCHSGEGALERLGVTADYLNKQELRTESEFAQITCAVCHDPHGSDNSAQLRRPVETTDVSEHICAECHDRFAQPDMTLPQDYLRTHAPATGLLASSAGWFPEGSGLTPGSVSNPHASAERLCATCHVVSYSTVDEETGAEFFSQGHRFLAAPCVDANGFPTSEQLCALTTAARDFQGCVGCHHTDEQAAATALQDAVAALLPRVRRLASALESVDPGLTSPGGEIDADFEITVADNAYFTYTVALSGRGLPANDDAARRILAAALVHNPVLVPRLVEEALDALQAEYGTPLDGAVTARPVAR